MEAYFVLAWVGLTFAVCVFYIYCHIHIAIRLGYGAFFGILCIFPVVNVIMMGIAAMRSSPNEIKIQRLEREIRRLRGRIAVSNQQEATTSDALAELGR